MSEQETDDTFDEEFMASAGSEVPQWLAGEGFVVRSVESSPDALTVKASENLRRVQIRIDRAHRTVKVTNRFLVVFSRVVSLPFGDLVRLRSTIQSLGDEGD
jgi:hypothetical protein